MSHWIEEIDEPDITHYRAMVEEDFRNEANEESWGVLDHFVELVSDDADMTPEEMLDYDAQRIMWEGFDLTVGLIASHMATDCEDEDLMEHMLIHLRRAAAFTALVLMRMTDDLPAPHDS